MFFSMHLITVLFVPTCILSSVYFPVFCMQESPVAVFLFINYTLYCLCAFYFLKLVLLNPLAHRLHLAHRAMSSCLQVSSWVWKPDGREAVATKNCCGSPAIKFPSPICPDQLQLGHPYAKRLALLLCSWIKPGPNEAMREWVLQQCRIRPQPGQHPVPDWIQSADGPGRVHQAHSQKSQTPVCNCSF